MGKRYTFVLNFGYVESQSLSYMPWVSEEQFKDAKEALVDLATFLKEQFMIDRKPKLKKCCTASKEKDPSSEFCSKCGAQIKDMGFDGEDFSDWLYQMGFTNTDGFHAEFIEWNQNDRWQAGQMEGSPNHRYVYNAEHVLAAAVGHPKDLKRTFGLLCKERTKSKLDSFTYY